MEPEFWHERWEAGEIGFHQKKINVLLEKYWHHFARPSNGKVFVPLCGKSKDMLWLAEHGHPVIGIEISRLAIETFFAENELLVERRGVGLFESYRSGDIELLAGDFFNLSKETLKDCELVYDRAALIALPAELRKRYVAHLREIISLNTAVFLITLDYDPDEMSGPPFAVPPFEVERLFSDFFSIKCLFSREVLAMNPRFIKKGLSELKEAVYLLTPK